MSRFAIFSIFYMTAFLLEVFEKWQHPIYNIAFFILVISIIVTRVTLIKFLLFLILTTAYFLLLHFPEVANHVNFLIYCNIAMITVMVYSFIHHRNFGDDDYFEMIQPLLQMALILVYFLAGFHKLNIDFFLPEVSCAGSMFNTLLWAIVTSNILGIPTILVIATTLLFVLWQLAKKAGVSFSRIKSSKSLLILGIGVTISLFFLPTIADNIDNIIEVLKSVKSPIIIVTAIVVILWEIIGAILLLFPKFQFPIVLFSWAMHSVLALHTFADFGSLAFALLLTFIPYNYFQLLSNANVDFWGFKIHRVYIYLIINVIGGIILGIHFQIYPFLDSNTMYTTVSGILLNLASLIFIWPILSIILIPSHRLPWGGVSILNRKIPVLISVFLAFLFFHGMTPYLGLRTTGNFSMFSNLRTEGEISNHFLLRSNPLKVWGYQEDAVRLIEINDDLVKIGHHYQPLKGNKLPVVEFKKLIYKWDKAGYTVPLIFEYQGDIYSTEDIVNDSVWGINKRNWEMVLMDFRVIQSEGANKCRW